MPCLWCADTTPPRPLPQDTLPPINKQDKLLSSSWPGSRGQWPWTLEGQKWMGVVPEVPPPPTEISASPCNAPAPLDQTQHLMPVHHDAGGGLTIGPSITTPTFSIQWMTYRGWICTFTYVVIWLRTTRIFWFPCCNKLLAKCSWANIAKSHTKCVVSCVCAHVQVPSKAMYDHTNIHLFKCKDAVQFVPHFVQATHLLLMIE